MSERQLTFTGALFDGRSAARQRVTVRLEPGRLTLLREGKQPLKWPFSELSLKPLDQAGHPPVQLDHIPPGASSERLETLVVDDAKFLTSLHALGPDAPGFGWRERRTNRRLFLIAGVILVPLFCYAIWAYGIPTMADRVATEVPVAWEEELGETILKGLSLVKMEAPTPEAEVALEAIVARLLTAAPDQPYRIRVHVYPVGMINALALPGGHIVVFQGLLNASDSAEELAGVLAHEIQHVLKRHSTRGILRALASSFLLTLMVGDVNGVMQSALSLADNLEGLKFSRAMETEADTEGLKMLLASGVDPEAMVTMFKKFAAEEKQLFKTEDGETSVWESYLSSHPATDKRVAGLKALIERAPASAPRPLYPDGDWAKIMHKNIEN